MLVSVGLFGLYMFYVEEGFIWGLRRNGRFCESFFGDVGGFGLVGSLEGRWLRGFMYFCFLIVGNRVFWRRGVGYSGYLYWERDL